jgi:hypothetical protein
LCPDGIFARRDFDLLRSLVDAARMVLDPLHDSAGGIVYAVTCVGGSNGSLHPTGLPEWRRRP